MSSGDVLDGAIITSPASLISGEAATAAAEQEVPMMPSTCGSVLICSAPALPPSGEHLLSIDSPRSIAWPWMSPKSRTASSMPERKDAPSDDAPVSESSERICTASLTSTIALAASRAESVTRARPSTGKSSTTS